VAVRIIRHPLSEKSVFSSDITLILLGQIGEFARSTLTIAKVKPWNHFPHYRCLGDLLRPLSGDVRVSSGRMSRRPSACKHFRCPVARRVANAGAAQALGLGNQTSFARQVGRRRDLRRRWSRSLSPCGIGGPSFLPIEK